MLPPPRDSLARLLDWVVQPILQIQNGEGVLCKMESDGCKIISSYFKVASVTEAKGLVTGRFWARGSRVSTRGGHGGRGIEKANGPCHHSA